MGEDPAFHQSGEGLESLAHLVKRVKVAIGLPLMISPGVVKRETLEALHAAGADWYACYQETHNRRLFRQLRPNQDYDARLAAKVEAHQMGLLTEEGILAGVGESLDDIVTSMAMMKTLGAHQLRVMTFVPQKGTPLEKVPLPSSHREQAIIAVMRLLFPDRLIPASLDVGGIKGLRDRLLAGANVVTSLIPPQTGFVGVSQSALDIDEGYRTVEGAIPVLGTMGLRMATQDEYSRWLLQASSQGVTQSLQTGKTQ
jgi:methylornithine synthase